MTMSIGIDISKDWLDIGRFPDAPGGIETRLPPTPPAATRR